MLLPKPVGGEWPASQPELLVSPPHYAHVALDTDTLCTLTNRTYPAGTTVCALLGSRWTHPQPGKEDYILDSGDALVYATDDVHKLRDRQVSYFYAQEFFDFFVRIMAREPGMLYFDPATFATGRVHVLEAGTVIKLRSDVRDMLRREFEESRGPDASRMICVMHRIMTTWNKQHPMPRSDPVFNCAHELARMRVLLWQTIMQSDHTAEPLANAALHVRNAYDGFHAAVVQSEAAWAIRHDVRLGNVAQMADLPVIAFSRITARAAFEQAHVMLRPPMRFPVTIGLVCLGHGVIPLWTATSNAYMRVPLGEFPIRITVRSRVLDLREKVFSVDSMRHVYDWLEECKLDSASVVFSWESAALELTYRACRPGCAVMLPPDVAIFDLPAMQPQESITLGLWLGFLGSQGLGALARRVDLAEITHMQAPPRAACHASHYPDIPYRPAEPELYLRVQPPECVYGYVHERVDEKEEFLTVGSMDVAEQ